MYPPVGAKIRRVGLSVKFSVHGLDEMERLSRVCNVFLVEGGSKKFLNSLRGKYIFYPLKKTTYFSNIGF